MLVYILHLAFPRQFIKQNNFEEKNIPDPTFLWLVFYLYCLPPPPFFILILRTFQLTLSVLTFLCTYHPMMVIEIMI